MRLPHLLCAVLVADLALACGGEAVQSTAGAAAGAGVTMSASGGAGGAGGASGAAYDCNGATCSATQACIAYRTEGGALIFSDAGTCPTGEHFEGAMCQREFAYKCAELHGLCQNQPVSCACAGPSTNKPGVCPTGYLSCSDPGPTEDTVAQLICVQAVP